MHAYPGLIHIRTSLVHYDGAYSAPRAAGPWFVLHRAQCPRAIDPARSVPKRGAVSGGAGFRSGMSVGGRRASTVRRSLCFRQAVMHVYRVTAGPRALLAQAHGADAMRQSDSRPVARGTPSRPRQLWHAYVALTDHAY